MHALGGYPKFHGANFVIPLTKIMLEIMKFVDLIIIEAKQMSIYTTSLGKNKLG